MKNFFRIVMLALVICATSCAREDISSNLVGGGDAIEVTFTADLGDLGTRATTGKGTEVNKLYCNVFDATNDNELTVLNTTATRGTDGKFTFRVVMVKGMTYDLVLWAECETADFDAYQINGKEVTVTYNGAANDERYDAFCKFEEDFDPVTDNPAFTLTRPLAQLNAATNDYDDVKKSGITLSTSEVTISAFHSFNIAEGTASGKRDATFAAAAIPGGDLNGNATYEYLSANYLFVPATGALTDAVYTFKGKKTNGGDVTFTGTSYSAIPLKPNHRTNILGALLTKPTDFVVDINAGFTGSYDHVIWDGKSVSEPPYDATNKTYTIDEGSELAWLADAVNGTTRAAADSMKGKTIVLSESIDLGGAEWTPIGVGGNHFMGTFDGNGKTISNFRISKRPGDCNQAALFGTISGTVAIQNFTIKDVEIDYPGADDLYAAAVVGTFYGHVTLKDIVVEDCYISGNNKVAGLAAHDGVCSSLLIDNCHVKNSVLETLNEEDGGNVAGLLGLFQGVAKTEVANQPLYGVHKVENSSVTGCTINGGNKNSEGKRSSGEFIANFIGKDDQSLHINNCKIENNTFIQAGTYTSIYLPFVGGARNDDGKGTIYVDGKKIVAEGVTFDEQANTYYVSTAAGLAWVRDEVNKVGAQDPNIFDNATVFLTNDINLEGQEWKPIGDYGFNRTVFRGTFDGQDHTVKNFKITQLSARPEKVAEASYGLFGNVSGTIKNLTVEGAIIAFETSTARFAGALIGRMKGQSVIDNCHVKKSSVTTVHWQAGGVVGQIDNHSKIANSSIVESTITGYAGIGAIVGFAMNGGNILVEDCAVKDCTIAQNGSFGGNNDKMFGAVIGCVNNNAAVVDIKGCTVENTTILGEISDTICGYAAEGASVTINGKPLNPSVEVNGEGFATLEEAITAAKAGDVVTIEKDVTLSAELEIPAGVTIVGNGKQINGSIKAGGDLTFEGHTKVTGFNVGCYNSTITIGEGDCLEVTGTNRASLGYGNTFDITSNITDAKSTDKEAVEPSLILPGGFSITGENDAVFNIKNAYVKIGSTTSKNSAANGEFTINIENSIAEFTNQLTFSEPTNGKTPTFNLNVKNSVLTTATKLILSAPNCNMVVDNSTIDIKTYFRNSGNVELKNDSTLKGATIQFGENGGHDGVTVVDDSKFTITASSTGHAYDGKGVGSVTAKNGAEVSIEYYKALTINKDATSTFTGTEVF